jgi:ketosteroid isomerase-like protein
MSLTHEAVQAWLDTYLHAWETYDAADVEALFTEDAEYRYHPFDLLQQVAPRVRA